MSRAILTAPVARNLQLEFGFNIVKVLDATNGVLQAWDTMDREFYQDLNDPEINIYTRRIDVPAAIRPYLIMVRVLGVGTLFNSLLWDEAPFKRYADCGPADYFRIVGGLVKNKSQVVAGDRPRDWTSVHDWQGVEDDLSEN